MKPHNVSSLRDIYSTCLTCMVGDVSIGKVTFTVAELVSRRMVRQPLQLDSGGRLCSTRRILDVSACLCHLRAL